MLEGVSQVETFPGLHHIVTLQEFRLVKTNLNRCFATSGPASTRDESDFGNSLNSF